MTHPEIFRALQRTWHALLRDVDNAADHSAVQRAAQAASADHERLTGGWYATALNHYYDSRKSA